MTHDDVLTAYLEAYNDGRPDDLRALVAPDYVHHSGADRLTMDEFLVGAGFLRAGLPDFRIVADDRVASGDRVALRFHGTGTHAGSFRGEAASGVEVTLHGITIFRIVGGLIQEDWEAVDETPLYALLAAPA